MTAITRTAGQYVASSTAGETVQAFVPNPLPPSDPPIDQTYADGRLAAELSVAEARLGELWVATDLVPDQTWLIFAFVRQEAVLSSQIEGTQASLTDLLETEAWQAPARPDVVEVTNYIKALDYARAQLAEKKGLPLSVRLLCESHKRLLRGTRGANARPGQLRTTQNWIGGTRPGNAVFVPPPPAQMLERMHDLEQYLHDHSARDDLSPLARIGLVHAQFETIHPFLDGNGRLGRLLITLLLEQWKLTRAPILYLSLYFKTHQTEYYRRLNAIRTDGDWEGWLLFFSEAVSATAAQVVRMTSKLHHLWQQDQVRVAEADGVTIAAVRLMMRLPKLPIVSAGSVAKALHVTFPTASKAIKILERIGVVHPEAGPGREQYFRYRAYVRILKEGMTLSRPSTTSVQEPA